MHKRTTMTEEHKHRYHKVVRPDSIQYFPLINFVEI